MKKILLVVIIGVILSSVLLPILQVRAADPNPNNADPCAYGASGSQSCSYVKDGVPKTANYNPKGARCDLCCPEAGKGLMVCGTKGCPCGLCDFFVLIERIIDFLLFRIAPVAAVLLIIIGGVMFLISSGNPATITKAKSIIMSVIIGLTIMYTAYMVVGFILTQIGLSGWAHDIFSSWLSGGVFEIQCNGGGTSNGGTGSGGGSGTDNYCDDLLKNNPDALKNCLAVYGGIGTNQYFDQCEANPCHANPPNGCKVNLGSVGGFTKDHCENK